MAAAEAPVTISFVFIVYGKLDIFCCQIDLFKYDRT